MDVVWNNNYRTWSSYILVRKLIVTNSIHLYHAFAKNVITHNVLLSFQLPWRIKRVRIIISTFPVKKLRSREVQGDTVPKWGSAIHSPGISAHPLPFRLPHIQILAILWVTIIILWSSKEHIFQLWKLIFKVLSHIWREKNLNKIKITCLIIKVIGNTISDMARLFKKDSSEAHMVWIPTLAGLQL